MGLSMSLVTTRAMLRAEGRDRGNGFPEECVPERIPARAELGVPARAELLATRAMPRTRLSNGVAWACVVALLGSLDVAVAQPASRPALPTISWEASTLQLVQAGGDYGRMVQIGAGRVACVYDTWGKMWIRHSLDEGKTWQEPILVAKAAGCWLTNAELLVLQDGSLLYFWNERPLKAVAAQGAASQPGESARRFLIRMARSEDGGRSWSPGRTLYAAGSRYGDGCWEPTSLLLPSGEIQVYFSNEAPFTKTEEQEIALLRSLDGGSTWSKAERIAFRKGHRDGMPVPVLLAGGGGIAVSIEDNGYAGERFKPVILHTSLADNWRSGPIGGESPHRWGALAEPLKAGWYGGAPCLRRLPSGKVLLSYQEGADGGMDRCRMAVCVGDADARNFGHKTYPLPLGPKGNQLWNSLFVKDARTVVAISTATVKGVRGLWAVEGTVNGVGGE